MERGKGFEFADKVKGGAIPRQFISAVEDGIRETMETGGIAGYPIVDIKVTLIDGSYHEVDSSEMAFKMAGSMALKSAIRKGNPIILEPIMKVEVVSPGQFLGDVISDLSSRRGRITAIETEHAGACIIRCLLPLAESFGYTTTLRSITEGRATHTMQFYQYQQLPEELASEVKVAGKRNA